MFTEPLPWYLNTGDNVKYDLAKTDTDNGRSKYRYLAGNDSYEVSISSTVTNENKPFKTDRTLVRFDITKPSPTVSEVESKASAYLVLSTPRGDGAGVGDMQVCLYGLLRWLMSISAYTSTTAHGTTVALAGTIATRLRNGET